MFYRNGDPNFLPPTVLTGVIILCSLVAYFTRGWVKNGDSINISV